MGGARGGSRDRSRDIPHVVRGRVDAGPDDELDDGHPVDYERFLRGVMSARGVLGQTGGEGRRTSVRYAVNACASKFDVAESMAFCIVTLTIGGTSKVEAVIVKSSGSLGARRRSKETFHRPV